MKTVLTVTSLRFHSHWANGYAFFLFYLIFVLIITASWLRTTTTYVSVHEYTFVRATTTTSISPADIYSQQF